MRITKTGLPITTLEDWEQRAGPKSPTQWVDGRSAKEVARAWLESPTRFPSEVLTALDKHPDFLTVLSWTAEPEAKIAFDELGGEPRNSDLLVHARDERGEYVIAVEAKADEPFGETVAAALSAAIERYLENPRSQGVRRIEQLATGLLQPRQSGDPALREIRYQLLTACAGALSAAQRSGCERALLLVHEFVTDKTSTERHTRNQVDLNRFVHRLSRSAVTEVPADSICGPFAVPGGRFSSANASLYIGKVCRNLRGGIDAH
jgi:hypothetical protein